MAAGSRETLDPHYARVFQALDGKLDHDLFEEAVQDLLRDVYPGLAPIHGGGDAGLDAAVADGEGEAYPLSITTRRDSLRKFTEDLDKLSKQPRRKVVAATSRTITPQMRAKFHEEARRRGFTLVQVHDRRDFANRLYRNAGWAKKLLGITGSPPALSAQPLTRRPIVELAPIGREDDLEWLRSTAGDLLLVGVPGSGKTFLMVQLAHEGRGLFLASEDETAIANSIRELQPEAIFVDDAHFQPETLTRLRHLRTEIGAAFRIVASTWPGGSDTVADALGTPPSGQRRELELLTRAEIVEVLRQMGLDLANDDPWLRTLVDMSANKPGFAVTLGSLYLRGELAALMSGRTLARSQVESIRRLIGGESPEPILAAFALGGAAGMNLAAVRDHLGLSRAEAWTRISTIASGGVLEPTTGRTDILRVVPEPFRSPLIAEVFFGPTPLEWKELALAAPDLGKVAETLAVSALRGARIPRHEITDFLPSTDSAQAWGLFARLGPLEADWVLDNFPGRLDLVAAATLEHRPRRTIRNLLEVAQGEGDEGIPGPLKHWLAALPQAGGVDEVIQKRRRTIEAATEFVSSGGSRSLGLRTMITALTPRLEESSLDVTGSAVVLRKAQVPVTAVDEFVSLWRAIPLEAGDLDSEVLASLEGALREWTYPETWAGSKLDDTTVEKAHELPRRVIEDLGPLAQSRPGLASALAQIADAVGVARPAPIDRDFSVLYPIRNPDLEFRVAWEHQNRAAAALAAEWSTRPSREIVNVLALHEDEARRFGRPTPGKVGEVIRRLADTVQSPAEWCREFLNRDSYWAAPFLVRCVDERRGGWQELILKGMVCEPVRARAARVVLRLRRPPRRLLDAANQAVEPHEIEGIGSLPTASLRRLLNHENEEIAVAAAVEEWLAEPRGQVRRTVRNEWTSAFVRAKADEEVADEPSAHHSFWVREILSTDSRSAWAWLKPRLDDPPQYLLQQSFFHAAVRSLTRKQRMELLDRLRPGSFADSLLPAAIDSSFELYRKVLARRDLGGSHLAPLEGRPPDERWIKLAELALAAGHPAQDLASASLFYRGAIRGWGLEHWERWKPAFEALLELDHPGLSEVGRFGVEMTSARIEEAAARQRQFELTGRF